MSSAHAAERRAAIAVGEAVVRATLGKDTAVSVLSTLMARAVAQPLSQLPGAQTADEHIPNAYLAELRDFAQFFNEFQISKGESGRSFLDALRQRYSTTVQQVAVRRQPARRSSRATRSRAVASTASADDNPLEKFMPPGPACLTPFPAARFRTKFFADDTHHRLVEPTLVYLFAHPSFRKCSESLTPAIKTAPPPDEQQQRENAWQFMLRRAENQALTRALLQV
jgi:hypothetical protein